MTLLELAGSVLITGILAGAAVRGWATESDRVRVMAAEEEVLEAYRAAQSAARARGRPAILVIAPNRIEVSSAGLTDTTTVLVRPGPAAQGVTLTPALHLVVFEPSGMATGAANVTHSFGRGGVTRQLVVSRLGRVRVI